MRYIIDTDEGTLSTEVDVSEETQLSTVPLSLYSSQAFETIQNLWVQLGHANKYSYQWTWMGRPVIQLPQDLMKIQEIIWEVKPEVIIETGVAHGGSLVFYASLCRAMNKGRVVGIEKDLRGINRDALKWHGLNYFMHLIEGDSVGPDTLSEVKDCVYENDPVMVILDSNHTKDHVLKELELYGPLVTPGSYLIVFDGIMKDLADAPHAGDDWEWNNPHAAVEEFLKTHDEFEQVPTPDEFNESGVFCPESYITNGILRRR